MRELVEEQLQYRELLYQITLRDLLIRYKQTVMGFGWAVFVPLVNTVVFSVIFTRVAPIETGMPYPLFAYCGFLVWNFTASSLRFAVGSLTSNTNLVTKVYFPREIFPVSAVLVSLVDFAVGGVLLVVIMAYYHVMPTVTVLTLPIVVAVQLLFTTGIALLLAMGNLFYRDVKYLFDVLITVWMFMTSVVYPTSVVGGLAGYVLRFNPMTPIIDAYRDVLIRGVVPHGGPFVIAAVTALMTCGFGWLVFHRAEYNFAENV